MALRSVTGVALIAAKVLASGVTSIDANVVKVAVPAIGRSLGASVSARQWTLTTYLVAVATLLLAGALADRFGRRRVLVIGLLVMLVSSVLCAVAPSAGALIGATGGGSYAPALAHGYQPAMIVMAGLCVAAALVTGLSVTDSRAAAPQIVPNRSVPAGALRSSFASNCPMARGGRPVRGRRTGRDRRHIRLPRPVRCHGSMRRSGLPDRRRSPRPHHGDPAYPDYASPRRWRGPDRIGGLLNLAAIGPRDQAWISERLCLDNLKITGTDANKIRCTGDFLDGAENFAVHAQTRELREGRRFLDNWPGP